MRGLIYSLLLVAFALDCSAQTLADVARRERERQKRLHSTVVVANGATTTTTASTSSTAATTAVAAPEANAARPTGPTDNKGHDEKYWRDQFQKARDAARAADAKVQVLELRVRDLNTLLLRQSDIYNREYRLGPEIADAQKQLDDARVAADQAKKKITDLEDELRRSGGPPGWAR
jgi:chromosome segregation ATPase